MAGPCVSIIIANYNYGKFLGEAIESALAQTHPSVEVIVVDDGSTDDSLSVAGGYAVTLITQHNQGVGTARNQGALAATGSYLVFLDADDVLEPTYVAQCLAALQQTGESVAYAYTGMRFFGTEEQIFPSREFTGKALLAGNYVHVSALMRRQAFEAAGGFDPTWKLGYEDYELWVRMLHCGFQGVLVPAPLLRYRRHGGGRNALSETALNSLRWRLRLTYPGFYWRKIVGHPLTSLQFLVHFWGQLHRPHGICQRRT